MDELEQMRRGCLRKVRYPSKSAAADAAKKARAQRGARLRKYHCQWCGLWHLTSAGHRAANARAAKRRRGAG